MAYSEPTVVTPSPAVPGFSEYAPGVLHEQVRPASRAMAANGRTREIQEKRIGMGEWSGFCGPDASRILRKPGP